ncbi:YrrS family protein [Neobacillus sp. SAB-20_R2A]|uniref:YrrS family protein n=1 Tax=Neobacillus sp. SAB-20_R2A TaxID=3120519 RepID=UPI003C6E43E7
MNNDFKQNSRSTYRAKRKKTNIVLNSLIIIVLALIILVAYNIFASGSDEKAVTKQETPKQEQKQAAPKEKKAEETKKKEKPSEDKAVKEEDVKQSEEATAAPEKADDSQAVVTDGGTSPNVVKTIENPAWKPVGTTQTGEHTAVYDQSSVDWQEMLKAVSYATGLDSGNMTVYWLGRDKTTANASFATVASKDKQQKYNVYIKWVDGEGWMPTRVEELAEIQQ